jgi:hypothetical protein
MSRKRAILGWRERAGLPRDFKLFYATAVEQAMLDEITELRDRLGLPDTLPERLVDPRQMSLIEWER